MNSNMKQLMKLAALLEKQDTLRKQLAAIRNQTHDLYCSSEKRGDHLLIIGIPLGQFLTLFPDVTPRVSNWDHETDGRKTAMHYGPIPAGFSIGETVVQIEAWTPWVESKQIASQTEAA